MKPKIIGILLAAVVVWYIMFMKDDKQAAIVPPTVPPPQQPYYQAPPPGGQPPGTHPATTTSRSDNCVGAQTFDNVNGLCVNPTCVGHQTVINGVCSDPTCIGDQTLDPTTKICINPVCPIGQNLLAGKCIVGVTGANRVGTTKPTCADGFYEYNGVCIRSAPAVVIPGAMATFYDGCGTIWGKTDSRNTSCGNSSYPHPWSYKGTSMPKEYDFVYPCEKNQTIYQSKIVGEADCGEPIKVYKCPWGTVPGNKFQSESESNIKCPTTRQQIPFRMNS